MDADAGSGSESATTTVAPAGAAPQRAAGGPVNFKAAGILFCRTGGTSSSHELYVVEEPTGNGGDMCLADPGGKWVLEDGPDPVTTAKREFKEETGVEAPLWNYNTLYVPQAKYCLHIAVPAGSLSGGRGTWVSFADLAARRHPRLGPALPGIARLVQEALSQ